MKQGRFWLVHSTRDDLVRYGVAGTYYLLREDHGLFETLYVMWVAGRMNRHAVRGEAR